MIQPHNVQKLFSRVFSTMLPFILICLLHLSLSQNVEQWDRFELTLNGPSDKNPFVDYYLTVNFSFSDDDEMFLVHGFYDGDGVYKARFMPNKIGPWKYHTSSNVESMNGITGSFNVIQPTNQYNYGPVNVDYTTNRSFIFANGKPYFPVGTTSYAFHYYPNYTIINQSLATFKYLAENDIFNKVRFEISPSGNMYPLPHYPYIGTPPNQWGDYNIFNVSYWKYLDFILDTILNFNSEMMVVDLILFHSNDQGFYGFDCMGCPYPNNKPSLCPNATYNTSNDEFYLKYLISRVGSYRNVWYTMSNEYNLVQTKSKGLPSTFPTWDRLFTVLSDLDIYNKQISIHQHSNIFYNYSQPYLTHFSVQGDSNQQTGSDYDYKWFQQTWNVSKPVILDEVQYEGTLGNDWWNLTAFQEIDRFWMGVANGNMITHGESIPYFPDNDTSKQQLMFFWNGNKLIGESWKYVGWFNKYWTNKLTNITDNFRIHLEFHELVNVCYEYFPSYPHCNIGYLMDDTNNEYYFIHFSDYENQKHGMNYSKTISIDLGGEIGSIYELSMIDMINQRINVLETINITDTNSNFTFTSPSTPYNLQLIKL